MQRRMYDGEAREWAESMEAVLKTAGPEKAKYIVRMLLNMLHRRGESLQFATSTPYINSIPKEREPEYPGDGRIEWRIRSLIRWNALAMVVRANREEAGIGGHISTYASLATLLEVGFNHFFHAKTKERCGDLIYFQGHAAPGIYARAFLEGRLDIGHLERFRLEMKKQPGLSSYPHPWLMPDFWEFPTVSMGLAAITAIYQARFSRYLENRGLHTCGKKIWAFIGDGETDEPESLGALTLASREKLDNLIFVVNCNLQRLDGPVRGNGKIVQELEAAFRGAGWHVIKVLWGGDWDALLAKDKYGLLQQRMDEAVDGDYQNYAVKSGAWTREHFFGKYPELLKIVEHLSDDEIMKLRRGGHEPDKVYAAYKEAVQHKGAPVVILAKTIKGYGLGEAGEGRNITHQQKKLNEAELLEFRRRFQIPIPEEQMKETPFYRPPEDSEEIRYLLERRKALGGFVPQRMVRAKPLKPINHETFAEVLQGSGGREVSTTMAFVRLLTLLLRHPEAGKLVVPIVPDEARTFGMDALFRQVGIYASQGQLYEPVDSDVFLYYREAKDGQILEEGITEAGSMASFIAAGTAYATHGINTIPFFCFYSMFGFQRVGDLIWSCADSRGKGFLMGGTAGRTTLAGEGLQHQDGHSLLLASTVPNLQTYDPAFAYEIAVIVQDGIRRMYTEQEDIFYYITMYNENYAMPPMPDGVEEGILKGIYRLRAAEPMKNGLRVQMLGSGPMIREALRAQQILAEKFNVQADVWCVTSYNLLRREALDSDRWNRLHPAETPRVPYLNTVLDATEGPIIAVSDFMKIIADQIAPWLPGRLASLGTDGFGRSNSRSHLRRFFEIDAEHIALAALHQLASQGKIPAEQAERAVQELGLNPEKANPATA
ncbi:MAG: pyruvate dehydrogenase (acetyl-transferring), homodimeric type [Acidobacteria bacterium RIFCSPLOWO2_12_FULL_54_10]|nr:MAG: pyruvate dehydrogenase (acetyl-transferring), homodimeric type [Acidobacteria bacterium RIFCSPLOWO2_12_FULL_54_10]